MTIDDDGLRFRVLSREECQSLLARNRVGRIAFQRGHRIDIVPLHYVFANGVICGRTARDTRLEKASENFPNAWPAAFEVDEVDDLFDWRSVVVHGNLHAATPGDKEWRRNAPDWEKAVRSFRTLIPEAFTGGDPTPFRAVLVRLDVVEISGREARPDPSGRRVSTTPRRSGRGRTAQMRLGEP